MKTINEQVSVSFVAATISDAICMMPIVDEIVEGLHQMKKDAEKKPPYWQSDAQRLVKDFNRQKRQLRIMLECGFAPSDEDLADQLMSVKLENILEQHQWDEKGKLVEKESK